MSAEFFLIVAVVFVVGSLWVWLNIILFAKKKPLLDGTRSGERAGERGADLAPPTAGAQDVAFQAMAPAVAPTSAVATPVSASASATTKPLEEVEVVTESVRKPNVFARRSYPYRLNETVPTFESELWKTCFYRLTEEEQVLGWVAFAGETVGASDRDYDANFLDVLRAYQRTVEKLRKEVGLSHVSETSVVAEEGKIWFFSVVDETWLALFADHSVDVHELANRLISPVRQALAASTGGGE